MGAQAIEYRDVLDKSGWERGPWDDEPDKAQWSDEATGLPCLIVRHRRGNLCGYVGVPNGHPWYGKDYDNCEVLGDDPYPDVHGGLTFAGPCQHSDDPSRFICHVPAPGEPDDVWWLGFDCAHAWDYSSMSDDPAWRARWAREPVEVYRDFSYVQRECAKLAAQAMHAKPSSQAEEGTPS